MATTLERVGRRLYFANLPFAAKDAVKAIGASWDVERKQWWIGTGKLSQAEALVNGVNEPPAPDAGEPTPEDVSKCRAYAQVTYKGRRYYVIAETKDLTRCRLTTLDGMPPFWANCSDCELVRRYEGRPVWDGRRNSGRTEMQYPTIRSLREYRDQQTQRAAAGEPACAVCGKRGGLIEDLEDGLLKCPKCCDIPSE